MYLITVVTRTWLDGWTYRSRTESTYRADRIICVSNSTRNHLHELLDDTPLTAAPTLRLHRQQQQFRKRHGLPEEFLLVVGRDRPNKNLDRLIVVYPISGLTLPLYITGSQNSDTRRRLSELARVNKCKGHLHWLGSLSKTSCPCCCHPPAPCACPLPSKASACRLSKPWHCNTPVLTSAGCATEGAAGGHAVLVDPLSIESIADGLVRVLQTTDT